MKWISLSFVVLFISCTDRPVQIDRSMKKAIDTLYRNERIELAKTLDQECDVLRDSLYQKYFDSILQVRVTERENILKK